MQYGIAVTEMASTIHEVARNASEAASATTEASSAAVNGKMTVQQAIRSIDTLADYEYVSFSDQSKLEFHAIYPSAKDAQGRSL
jgi:hypothetical protein